MQLDAPPVGPLPAPGPPAPSRTGDRGPLPPPRTPEGCYFDLAAAERVREFFSRFLRHSKGQFAGQKFDLLGWQWEEIIKPLFGWRRADGTRRYRRAYIEVPKKNGKSTLCAGIALYLLIADGEPGAEVYSAAADRDQASIVFNEALAMVNASPALATKLEARPSVKRLDYPRNGSWYKAMSAEAPTKEGLNWHGLIFDELHAQKTRELWDTLRYGGAARRQPLLVAITTAGYDRSTVCWEQHCHARGVLDGSIDDDAFFAYLAGAGEEEDWKDPAVWKKANPSYGVTISASSFEDDFREAEKSPSQENSFRRYRLNQWTEQDTRWLSLDVWDACAGTTPDLSGRVCYAGLDLAATTDLCALSLVFPEEEKFVVLPFFWAPERAAAERERLNRPRLRGWAKDGFLTLTPGEVVDYEAIRAKINALNKKYRIKQVALDRWNAVQLATQLQEHDGFNVVAFGQGFASMSAPTKRLEELLLEGRILHGGHPVLRWNAGNVSVRTDPAGNLKPCKEKSLEKIDGIVATIMGLALATADPRPNSVYEGRGIDVL